MRAFWLQGSEDVSRLEGAAQGGERELRTPPGGAPDVLLAPGFLGGWRRLAGLSETYALASGDLPGADPFAALAAMTARLPPDGVLAGYLSYEVAACAEPGLTLPAAPGLAGRTLPAAWAGVFARAEPAGPPPPAPVPSPAILPGEPRAAYEAKVARVVEAILDGALFQANLSRRLSAEWSERPDPSALFGRLTGGTDAGYAALISLPEGAVLSASPELFLEVTGDRVAAEPIKGTRPRGATPAEDAAFRDALLASQKDRAENVMIADLMRNDLSRVCRDGTMEAVAVCAHRALPRVHHLYSRIEARLADRQGPWDALRAAYPCGSITGAPKLAAMRLIAELEGEGRGPYCGTVFAVTRERAAFSVPIRTGVLIYGESGARLDVRAGGGVTALSDPAAEWTETEDKAYPFGLMVGA